MLENLDDKTSDLQISDIRHQTSDFRFLSAPCCLEAYDGKDSCRKARLMSDYLMSDCLIV